MPIRNQASPKWGRAVRWIQINATRLFADSVPTQAARREFESQVGPISGYGWRKAVRIYRQTALNRGDDIWDGYRRRSLNGPASARDATDWSEIAASVAAYNVFDRPTPIRVIARRLANRGYDVSDGDIVAVVAMRAGAEFVRLCDAAG